MLARHVHLPSATVESLVQHSSRALGELALYTAKFFKLRNTHCRRNLPAYRIDPNHKP